MKLRLRFTKLGRVRFLSHRDVARVWERTIRKAELPIAYSEGFSPRPKVHFGLALSVGHTSDAEYLDLDLREPVQLDGLADRLTACLPPGMAVTALAELDAGQPSLQAVVDVVTWRFTVDGEVEKVTAAADALLGRDEIAVTITRKGVEQSADLRPALLTLSVEETSGGEVELVADLATRPRSFRPAELLAAFDPPLGERYVHRVEQWIIDDGARRPPLAVGAQSPPELELQGG